MDDESIGQERRKSQISEAEIQLLVNKYIDKASDKIADKCVDRIKNAQHDCEAFRIFRDKDNILRFYNTEKKIDDHIVQHKEREETEERLYARRHKNTLLFVALINSPTIYFIITKFVLFFK